MLTEVADGVFVRQSTYCLTNAVAVRGDDGVLLVDPGVTGEDLAELADDLDRLGTAVSLGFATHPHWDHVLWHARFGAPRRVGTAGCADAARSRRKKLREQAMEVAPDIDPSLLGRIAPLGADAAWLAWSGPAVQVLEHRAHAPGHAALLIPHAGVLVAGDMLSDVEIPLFDAEGHDPARDYAIALDELARVVGPGVTTLVPGHGSVAYGEEIGGRFTADRAYVDGLLRRSEPLDPRVAPGASYGTDWLPEAHRCNVELVR